MVGALLILQGPGSPLLTPTAQIPGSCPNPRAQNSSSHFFPGPSLSPACSKGGLSSFRLQEGVQPWETACSGRGTHPAPSLLCAVTSYQADGDSPSWKLLCLPTRSRVSALLWAQGMLPLCPCTASPSTASLATDIPQLHS